MTNKKTPTKNNKQPAATEQILVVNADDVTVEDLLLLEEAKTVRQMIDSLIRFTANADDPAVAETLIRGLSLRQLLSQRAGLIEPFQALQSEIVPN